MFILPYGIVGAVMFDSIPLFRTDEEGERAVSPVIGVILMVAITVILAAVIASFVLGLGDTDDPAPNLAFDTDVDADNNKTIQIDTGDSDADVDRMEWGGDVDNLTMFEDLSAGEERVVNDSNVESDAEEIILIWDGDDTVATFDVSEVADS